MNARDVIVRPIVTEKTTKMQDHGNWVTFEVARKANKIQVADAIREIYGIKPVAVNVANNHPKTRRVGRYSGKVRAIKRAMVKLPEGSTIDIFAASEN